MSKNLNRRRLLKKAMLVPSFAGLAVTIKNKALSAQPQKENTKSDVRLPKSEIKGLPAGRIGNVKISRLICGGNLISGWTHSRDLAYVSALSKAYNTDKKSMDTLELAEENGINTIIAGGARIQNKYWKERGGKIQWIAQVHPKVKDLKSNIKAAIDNGAVGAYVHGALGDKWIKNGRVDLLGECVSFIKQNRLIAGIGGHSIEVPIACEKAGIDVDFYMKTLHHGNYWSVTPKEKRVKWSVDSMGPDDHDNIWSLFPERTIEFFAKLKKPWIAFKVLAAGAIHPKSGFRYAFENGADFICVGMYDFQVREDVILAKDILSSNMNRQRPWQA
ncbi:MAG: hypothetical protein ACYS67_00675 [Planctomycetota bacterium]|jgi:hypothetical protein